jgi:hypothetical protein
MNGDHASLLAVSGLLKVKALFHDILHFSVRVVATVAALHPG